MRRRDCLSWLVFMGIVLFPVETRQEFRNKLARAIRQVDSPPATATGFWPLYTGDRASVAVINA
jgi:hypothetical protein